LLFFEKIWNFSYVIEMLRCVLEKEQGPKKERGAPDFGGTVQGDGLGLSSGAPFPKPGRLF
jgi:hypothetical protein